MAGQERLRRIARDIAAQAVRMLLARAREAARRGDIEYARRLVEEAWEVVKRVDIPTPRSLRRGVCKRCKTPLIPGVTARVRLEPRGGGSRVVVTCLICGWMKRYHYKGRARENRPQAAEGDSAAGASRRHHRQEGVDGGGPQGDRPEAEAQGRC